MQLEKKRSVKLENRLLRAMKNFTSSPELDENEGGDVGHARPFRPGGDYREDGERGDRRRRIKKMKTTPKAP